MSSHPMEFRKDIEGLRAVAIGLVIAAHAGLPWLQGGFVGVDVFFVLSGYLITTLIVTERQLSGRFDFASFYVRRVKRLLPGLLVTVAVTCLAAAVLLAPHEQLAQSRDVLPALLWYGNLHFSVGDVDYFAAGAAQSLFLHTWSLGVEEQFYLVWPALVLFLLGTWKWQDANMDRGRLSRGLVAAALLSFSLCAFLSWVKPMWGFYLMPARAWQFALGAMVAVGRLGPTGDARTAYAKERAASLLAWCGPLLIVASAALLDPGARYPLPWALLPSAGAAATLWAGGRLPGAVPMRALSTRPMQWLGRISYSWYLWHWPVLLLGHTLIEPSLPAQSLGLVGTSLLIATASYRFIERPLRNAPQWTARPGAAVGGAALATLLAAATLTQWSRLADNWASSPQQQALQDVRHDLPEIYAMGCDTWYSSPQVNACVFGDPAAAKTAVLVGDSILAQWFPALQTLHSTKGWRLIVLTKSSCPMVDEPFFYERIKAQYVVCERWRDAALRYIAELRPDVVYLGSAVTYPYSSLQWTAGTQRVLQRLSPAANRVYIIRATPRLPFDGPNCIARERWRGSALLSQSACAAAVSTEPDDDVHASLRNAARPFANVELLDLNPLLCPEGVCRAQQEAGIVFRDSQHVAASHISSLTSELAIVIARRESECPDHLGRSHDDACS